MRVTNNLDFDQSVRPSGVHIAPASQMSHSCMMMQFASEEEPLPCFVYKLHGNLLSLYMLLLADKPFIVWLPCTESYLRFAFCVIGIGSRCCLISLPFLGRNDFVGASVMCWQRSMYGEGSTNVCEPIAMGHWSQRSCKHVNNVYYYFLERKWIRLNDCTPHFVVRIVLDDCRQIYILDCCVRWIYIRYWQICCVPSLAAKWDTWE